MALSLMLSMLPAVAQESGSADEGQSAGAEQQAAGTQASQDQVQVGENRLFDHDDPRPTRGRDAVGVAVNPDDRDHMVMVNTDLYHFTCEYQTTFDGGVTWESGRLEAPEGFGAPSGDSQHPCSSVGHLTASFKGEVTFGSGDNVYIAFGSREFLADGAAGEPGQTGFVARSTDGGRTFETAQPALPSEQLEQTTEEGDPVRSFHRYPSVAAIPGGGSGGQDRLISTSRESEIGNIRVKWSDDGGDTWQPEAETATVNPIDQEVSFLDGESLTTGPNGNAYVAWRSPEFEGEIRVSRSTDGGETWETFTAAPHTGLSTPDTDFGCCAYPRLDVAPDGTVHLVFTQGGSDPALQAQAQRSGVSQFDHFIHPDAGVFHVSSGDQGETWTDPVKVNDDPPAENGNIWDQTRHPDVTVDPEDSSKVHVSWQDRRHWYGGCQHTHAECDEARLGDTYWAHSTDGGQTFSDDVRVSDKSQNNDVGSDYRAGVYWSHSPVVKPLGNGEVFFAWMDSRQGNFETDALDIYYAKADTSANLDSIPQRRVPASNPGHLSTAMARQSYVGGEEATLTSTFATREWTRPVLVNQDDPAAALVGAVLGRAFLGPVLATPQGDLPAQVEQEAGRLEPAGAFVLGGGDAVGSQPVSEFTDAAGIGSGDVERFDGAPAEMAANVARRMNELDWPAGREEGEPRFEAAVIVNPDTEVGVAAAALAANRRLPVLFVNQSDVPGATSSVLDELNIDTTLVVGDESAVGAGVLDQLPNAERLGGSDIYEVSESVAQESLERGLPSNIVYVGDGENPVDAALTGAAVGRATGLFVLAPGADTGDARSTLDALQVTSEVDRLIAPGPSSTRSELSWACPEGQVPAGDFTDIGGNVHEGAIECASWYDFTAGGPGELPAEEYGPSLGVRRDQMASFIARLIDHAKPNLLPEASGDNPFTDVADGNVHSDAIRRLAQAGIVAGGPGSLPDDAYGPGLDVRRDQMASFINRALGFLAEHGIVTDQNFFGDVGSGNVHADNINALASEGVVLGTSEDVYSPGQTVRRDQMASFINRGLDFLVQHEEAQRPVLGVR